MLAGDPLQPLPGVRLSLDQRQPGDLVVGERERPVAVLIVDDVLATGGTASAAVRLMRKLGAAVVGVQVLIELGYLEGRQRLQDVKLVSEIVY